MRLRNGLNGTTLSVGCLVNVGLLRHGGLKRRMRKVVCGQRMRGKRCILCCRQGVLGNGLSIDGTQAVTPLGAGRATTFRHNETKKEENETAKSWK